MRVLLISVDFAPRHDGVSTLSYHYARRLAERGHEVMVVGPRAAGAARVDRAAPFRVLRFPGYSLGLARFFPFVLWSLAAFAVHRPDVLLPMNIGYGGLLAMMLAWMVRVRYVTVAYAYEFLKFRKSRALRALYLRIYGRSLFTVAVSRFTRDRLAQFGVDPDRIRVAHPGVWPGHGADGGPPAAASTAAWVIGTCGRLIRRKGHDVVIRALPRIRERCGAVRYRIAGSGPLPAELWALAEDLGVSEDVEYVGDLPDEELPGFYAALDVFVMASRQDDASGHAEGFGLVFLEAALRAVPSVATRTGGIPEAIVDGVTGVLVAQNSPAELAAAVAGLLNDPARLRRMGQAARERALREFNWNDRVDEVEGWLTEAGRRWAPQGKV